MKVGLNMRTDNEISMNRRKTIYYCTIFVLLMVGVVFYYRNDIITGLAFGVAFNVGFFRQELFSLMRQVGI